MATLDFDKLEQAGVSKNKVLDFIKAQDSNFNQAPQEALKPEEATQARMQAQQQADFKTIKAGQEKLEQEPPRLSRPELQEKAQEFDHFNMNEQGILGTNSKDHQQNMLRLENLLQKAMQSQIAFKDLPHNLKRYLNCKYLDEEAT
ncbi:hypothetical protein NHP21005_07170 [Helicobacter sp. NHP21005]|uniref:hypothetical protein n=1 Tax=Helicobacter felistomachi TaxID=3040201 RepID=UPI002573B0FA|nr:hypothetical protein [Helicobacter sp. NHP21005]BEG57029.1 hypothetical protein NHP21005_07170 [Helicobacter sp. NHP21005]